MTDSHIEDQFQIIQEESIKALEEVQLYQRKVMAPIWEKRREIVKTIPNFWSTAISNNIIFSANASENDTKALENLTDFHVEYDEANPKKCKVIATFKKNDVFKNETLTKEMIVDHEEGSSVVSKSTIEYHGEKSSRNTSEDEDMGVSFLDWFEDDSVEAGILLTDEIFPEAVAYYKGVAGFAESDLESLEGLEFDEGESE